MWERQSWVERLPDSQHLAVAVAVRHTEHCWDIEFDIELQMAVHVAADIVDMQFVAVDWEVLHAAVAVDSNFVASQIEHADKR